MPERFVPFPTVPEVPAHPEFVALSDSRGDLRVDLSVGENKPIVSVLFKARICYRTTDEGDRLRSMTSLGGKARTPICQVEDSDFVTWLTSENHNVRVAQPLRHWAIVTDDEIVEVISANAPVIHNGA